MNVNKIKESDKNYYNKISLEKKEYWEKALDDETHISTKKIAGNA